MMCKIGKGQGRSQTDYEPRPVELQGRKSLTPGDANSEEDKKTDDHRERDTELHELQDVVNEVAAEQYRRDN